MLPENALILAENRYYSMNGYETGLNNNVLVVGSSGCGKTRSIVEPNILQAHGSYIISDPKGVLCSKYAKYLQGMGYEVQILNFIHPEKSAHYNFFQYIRSERDVIKVAHMLVYGMGMNSDKDPFWDQAAELLLTALIAALKFTFREDEATMQSLLEIAASCMINEEDSSEKTDLDLLFDMVSEHYPDCFACRQYKKFRIAAGKTLKSILITLNAHLGKFDFDEMNKMTANDDLNLKDIGRKKKALFVIVSDTDRSLDGIVNMFFSQAMDELCRYADEECEGNRLPIDVRFIMDDFATNCKIVGFPSMISNIRARGISAMLMIQAESQLRSGYDKDADTIIANCDTYVYMGGNDIDTAQKVAVRCDLPYRKILNMPIGTNWIFRRGQVPVNGKNFPLDNYATIRWGEEKDREEYA